MLAKYAERRVAALSKSVSSQFRGADLNIGSSQPVIRPVWKTGVFSLERARAVAVIMPFSLIQVAAGVTAMQLNSCTHEFTNRYEKTDRAGRAPLIGFFTPPPLPCASPQHFQHCAIGSQNHGG